MAKLLRESQLYQGVDIIKNGGTVAFRTETVYGLGADATNDEAIKKIFQAKARPQENPLIIHFASLDHLRFFFPNIDSVALSILTKVKSALTILLPKPEDCLISPVAYGGGDFVAVRIPNCNFSKRFIRACGVPLAAPSANTSSRPSTTRWEDVVADLDQKADAVFMGRHSSIGLESTVIHLTPQNTIEVLRQGGASIQLLKNKTGLPVTLATHEEQLKSSPGTRFKHYSPSVPLYIGWPRGYCHETDFTEMVERINNFAATRHTIVLCATQHYRKYPGLTLIPLGRNAKQISYNLFKAIRVAEKMILAGEGSGAIVVEAFEDTDKFLSINERLSKASDGKHV